MIAQWIEHPPSKRAVAGSNPAQSVPNLIKKTGFSNTKCILCGHMAQKKGYISFDNEHLGSVQFSPALFSKEFYEEINSSRFKRLDTFQKHERISSIMLDAIQREGDEVFLLPQVVDYISHVKKILPTYHLTSFEFWLNNNRTLSLTEKLKIRGKIVGKWIPRSEYQNFFPLPKDSFFPGSHYSYGHISPDLDTTVASFACFLAAFGAKVGEARHHWVLPGGPPKESMEIDFFFKKALGQDVFKNIGSSSAKFNISALDLISQKNIIKESPSNLTYNIHPEVENHAVILTDERGCYLGDWRLGDVDAVRSVVTRFKRFLSEYQNEFIVGIISLFSEHDICSKDLDAYLNGKFSKLFRDSFSFKELTLKQVALMDLFIRDVLLINKGLNSTISDFMEAAKSFGFDKFLKNIEALKKKGFFDKTGKLIQDRSEIFSKLKDIFLLEKEAFNNFFNYIDTLEVAAEVKKKVLGKSEVFLGHLAEYDEIIQAMRGYTHLTVNYQENGEKFPLGVIFAEDLMKKVIATTSWNDFSNPRETDFKEYVEVISFIDHHKSDITTQRPSLGVVRADAQSSNSIISRICFEMNDKFSSGGMTKKMIEDQIQTLLKEDASIENSRLLTRLLQKRNVLETKGDFYVSPEREMIEYLQFIFAILDDTDLLTKVTEYDLDSMASLLNRLKTIKLKQEVEVINFDDLDRSDTDFAKKAALKLLKNSDLHSLYGVIYKAKEEAINQLVLDTARGDSVHFFQDTKVLGVGSYVAVGQFKHFVKNEPVIRSHMNEIRSVWVNRSKSMFKEREEVSLHMFMMSTVSSADELFFDKPFKPNYMDELWIWIPDNKKSLHHLKNFVSEFSKSKRGQDADFVLELSGHAVMYEKIFDEIFAHRNIKKVYIEKGPSMAIMKVDVGSMKSRKTDLAVYL